jgi:cytochrome c
VLARGPARRRAGLGPLVGASFCVAACAAWLAPAAAQERDDQTPINTGEEATRLRSGHLVGHGGPIKSIRVDPATARALTGSFDYTMMVWEVAGEEPRQVFRFADHDGPVNAVAFVPGGRRALAAGDDGAVALWDLETGRLVHKFRGHQDRVVALAVSEDGRWAVSASWDRTARVWDLLSFLPGPVLGGHRGPVNGDSGKLAHKLKAHDRPVLALAVLANPALVATGGADGVIRVMRAADGALIAEHRNLSEPIWALAFTSQGTGMYSGGLDDFAAFRQVVPQAPFEPLEKGFARRFQGAGQPDGPLAQGELQFARNCSICHTLTPDGGNRAGPTLHNLFGRKAGGLPGYPYSEALRRLDLVWTEDTVARLFELGPEHVTPGSKMPLQKISDETQRDALIAYLKEATAAATVDDKAGMGPGSDVKGGSR